jgi:hypothetical protein
MAKIGDFGQMIDRSPQCRSRNLFGEETYDRYEYLDEKRDALAALAALVDRIIEGRPTLVTLRRREAEANG